MPWIWENADWPTFTWDSAVLGGLLGEVRHRQGRLLGRMEAVAPSLRQQATVAALTDDVVRSSAIEGERLNRQEVRSSVTRFLVAGPDTPPRPLGDVDDMVGLSVDATQRSQVPLTAERLFLWHRALFRSGTRGAKNMAIGAWREPGHGPMQVVSGGVGRERVHFQAPPAQRVDAEMRVFLGWFEGGPAVDPVLKAAVAHFWFVTIHPFDDGNGRIARAIADLQLCRADASSARHFSMSAQIAAERKAYYAILEEQQRGPLDITPWLSWFLGCLGRAIGQAEKDLEGVLFRDAFWQRASKFSLNERQRSVLERLLGDFEGPLTTRKYARIAKCSPDTALRDLRNLLDAGLLVQNPGGGRSTSYRLRS